VSEENELTAPQPEGTPLPRPTPLSAPHWQGCQEGEFRVQRCNACGSWIFIPQPVCASCFSEDLEWTPTSGRGTVYSYTVVHRPQQPQFRVPYVVAIVEFEEGFHMLTNLIDIDPDAVKIGMDVEVCFVERSETITLPYFKPA
jgi:hypothetical protein